MTTRNRDRMAYPATDTEPAPCPAIEPPARPGDRHDSDPDGLSAPSTLSRSIRSESEPMDVILRKIVRATPRVPNSFEPSISRQVVHAPVPAVGGQVEAGEKVNVDVSAAERSAGAAASSRVVNQGSEGRTADPEPGGERQALTVHVRREAPVGGRRRRAGVLGLALAVVAIGAALLWLSRVPSSSSRTATSSAASTAPSAMASPPASAPEPPPVELSAPRAEVSETVVTPTPAPRRVHPTEAPAQAMPSARNARAVRSAAPSSEPTPAPAASSGPPVPSDIDRFIEPMAP